MKYFRAALLALTLTFFSMGTVVAGDLSSPTLWDVNIGPKANRPAPEKEKKEVPDSSEKVTITLSYKEVWVLYELITQSNQFDQETKSAWFKVLYANNK